MVASWSIALERMTTLSMSFLYRLTIAGMWRLQYARAIERGLSEPFMGYSHRAGRVILRT